MPENASDMELMLTIAGGIVIAIIALSLIAWLLANFELALGLALVLAIVIGGLIFLLDNPEAVAFVFSCVVLGGLVYLVLKKTDAEDIRLKRLHDEYIASHQLRDVIGEADAGSSVESMQQLSSKFTDCPYQVQLEVEHFWVTIDGGSAQTVVRWKANRLADRLRYERERHPANKGANKVRLVAIKDGLVAEEASWTIRDTDSYT
jgi:hypothetical protein